MEETYKIHVKCQNCDFKTSHPEEMLEIEKGTPIYIKLLNRRCPTCGCKELIKS